MSETNELSAITGLFEAVIGISTRNGVDKVLVYDRERAKNLLLFANWPENKISEFFDHEAIEKLGDLAPLFVTVDMEVMYGQLDRPTIH